MQINILWKPLDISYNFSLQWMVRFDPKTSKTEHKVILHELTEQHRFLTRLQTSDRHISHNTQRKNGNRKRSERSRDALQVLLKGHIQIRQLKSSK
jgi:hypothetical protein